MRGSIFLKAICWLLAQNLLSQNCFWHISGASEGSGHIKNQPFRFASGWEKIRAYGRLSLCYCEGSYPPINTATLAIN